MLGGIKMVAFYNWLGSTCALPHTNSQEKYFFAMMSAEGPTAGHCHSLATSLVDLKELGYNFDVCSQVGNCHVDDARNQLAARFLGTDADYLIFIDSDIFFDTRAIVQLIECDEPLCGASYPYKDGSGNYPGSVEGISFNDNRGYVPISGLPTGFMKIHRSVFEGLKSGDDCPSFYAKTSPGDVIHEFFNRTIVDGVRIGGDINFCRKVRNAGFKVWLVPKIVLGHTGHRTEEGCWWFKQSIYTHGVWPSVRSAIEEDRWANEQVLKTAFEQWGNMAFSGNTSLLQAMMKILGDLPEGPVLELGSGLTTVWLSTTGRDITTLEEDRAHLGKTWGVVDDFGPDFLARVNLVHAQTVDGRYQASKDIWDRHYAFCLVDGPWAKTENHKRDDCLKVNADVFLLDDCQRTGNIEVVKALEEKGYTTQLLPIPDRYIVVAWKS